MKELKRDLLTNKYTRIFYEDDDERVYNAPHHFTVFDIEGKELAAIDFQEGPIKECGINGVCNEDVICMVVERLECFQDSKFKCRENAIAITKLEEALLWLRKRTMRREAEGKEGTHEV